MKRKHRHLLIACIILLVAAAVLPADDLWDMALERASLDNLDMPSVMSVQGFVRNRSGDTITESEQVYVRDEATGEIILLSATENGKDATEKVRRQNERQQKRAEKQEPFEHPFSNPAESEGITKELLEYTAIIHERECSVYQFRLEYEVKMGMGRPKTIVEEGRLFLDKADGTPMLLESSLVEGPRMIQSASYRIHAVSTDDGSWRIEKAGLDFVGRVMAFRAGGFTATFDYSESQLALNSSS